MTRFLPGPGLLRTTRTALLTAFRAPRRQFWEVLASATWDNVSRALHAIMFAAALAVLLFSPAAHARSYDVFTADVPFKFNVGERTFRPGHYEFIFVGPGLVAVRDAQKEVIGSFITRTITTQTPAPSSKLVFVNDKKRQQLSQIWLENRTEGVQILREELAVRSTPPKPPVIAPDAMLFLTGRPEGPRLKQ